MRRIGMVVKSLCRQRHAFSHIRHDSCRSRPLTLHLTSRAGDTFPKVICLWLFSNIFKAATESMH